MGLRCPTASDDARISQTGVVLDGEDGAAADLFVGHGSGTDGGLTVWRELSTTMRLSPTAMGRSA